MAEIVSCPTCDARYVASATACAECGTPLTVGPVLVEGEAEEVGYDLADWTDEERAALATTLAAERLPARWEGAELVVRDGDADRVEELIDEIDNPDALPVDEADDDGGAEILSALYVAADVLRHDAGAAVAVVELLEASERAAELGPPYGVDGDLWREVLRRADRLADLLGEEAPEEDVTAAAGELREAVRPLV